MKTFIPLTNHHQSIQHSPYGPYRHYIQTIGTLASQLTAMTNTECATFFTTGSEAVMVAVRLAQAVTSRHEIVLFTNSYHGTFDNVLAAGWTQGERVSTFPTTDETPQGMLDEVIVLRYLEYATDLFNAAETQRIVGGWVALATEVANAPDTPRPRFVSNWPQLSQPNPAAAPVAPPATPD